MKNRVINSSKLTPKRVSFLQRFHSLQGFPKDKLTIAFSARHNGNMSLNYGDTSNALKNREIFLKPLGIHYKDLVCAKQVHGDTVKYAAEAQRGSGALSYDNAIPDTDAFIADRPGLALSIFTADCLSVFLYDSKKHAVGIAHAGWRSTKDNITAKTILSMKEHFKTSPEDLLLGFGPSIRSCCYEVSKDTGTFFKKDEVLLRGDKNFLNLVLINSRQAQEHGVRGKNIFDCGICTFCQNKDFYSYRIEADKSGRIMSVIMLK